jgi:hypothetical protein
MNRKQLTLLIVAGAVIVALGFALTRSKEKSYEAANQRLGQKVIANFPMNDVETITIKQPPGQQLNLAKTAEGWVVKERNGYAANFGNISDLLRKIWELKVAQPVRVGQAQLARLELTPPDNTTNSGTVVEFKDKAGKTINTLTLGKKTMRESPGGESPMGGGGGYPNGRFLMVGADVKTVAVVSEPFGNVEAKPADWIDKEFFKVEKQKLIAVASATNNWKLARDSETNEWKLADLKPGEQLDSSKSSSVTSALSWPSFTDVATEADPAKTGLDKPQITAKLETFDGFAYDVKVGKKVAEDKDDYYMQVATDANLVKERAPGKDEKPEDKTKLDKEFKEKVDKLAEKLKNEKALAKWTYIVPKYTLEPLFKDRKDLLAEKKEEKTDEKDAAPKTEPVASAPVKVEPIKVQTPQPEPAKTEPAKAEVKPATPRPNRPPPPPPPMPPMPSVAPKKDAPPPPAPPAPPATNASVTPAPAATNASVKPEPAPAK